MWVDFSFEEWMSWRGFKRKRGFRPSGSNCTCHREKTGTITTQEKRRWQGRRNTVSKMTELFTPLHTPTKAGHKAPDLFWDQKHCMGPKSNDPQLQSPYVEFLSYFLMT